MSYPVRLTIAGLLFVFGCAEATARLIERTVYVNLSDAELTCNTGINGCGGGWNFLQYLESIPLEPFVLNDGDSVRITVLFRDSGFRILFDPLNPIIWSRTHLVSTGQTGFTAKSGCRFGLLNENLEVATMGYSVVWGEVAPPNVTHCNSPGPQVIYDDYDKGGQQHGVLRGEVLWILDVESVDVAGFVLEYNDVESVSLPDFPDAPALPVEFGAFRLIFDPLVDMAGINPLVRSTGPTSIRLAWTEDAAAARGFRVESKAGECDSGNAWQVLADTDRETNAIEYAGLSPNSTYSFRYATHFGGGDLSPFSICVSTTTGQAGTPMTPLNLRASSRSNTSASLSWEDTSTNETSFKIFRKTGTADWTALKSVSMNTRSFIDTTATGNRNSARYSYDVRACNSMGCSKPNPAPELPFTPTNLIVATAGGVSLQWTDSSTAESGFQVQRKQGACDSAKPWVLGAFPEIHRNQTEFKDESAIPGSTYSYRVRAFSQGGPRSNAFSSASSPWSNCVSATAP